jgi:hypothetical protein
MREGLGGYAVLATNEPDKLLAGADIPVLVEGVTIKTGQGILTRGSVIGIETATDKGILCDSAAADGSKAAKYILAEDSIDTTAADVLASCYKSGKFNRKVLIFGANGAPATLDEDLRDVGMYLADEKSY